MSMNNIFEATPKNLSTEVFEKLIEINDVTIERIISKGHKSPESGWHDQNKNEWLMVLQGEATLSFDDESSIKLEAGDYINITAHTKHEVTWTKPDIETIWLAVHY